VPARLVSALIALVLGLARAGPRERF